MTIPISVIRTDGGTQPRAGLDFEAIEDYTEHIAAGANFPAVDVFFDGEHYWLAHGFHRLKATWAAERDEIECNVHQGTVEDARWFSYAANATSGLRRTRDDVQRAVKSALQHARAEGLSNCQIAKHVGCDEGTIRHWREKLHPTSEIPKSTRRTGRDGRTIDTSKIGRKTEKPKLAVIIMPAAAGAPAPVRGDSCAMQPAGEAGKRPASPPALPRVIASETAVDAVLQAAEGIIRAADVILTAATGQTRFSVFLTAVQPQRYADVAGKLARAADVLQRASSKLRERAESDARTSLADVILDANEVRPQ